MRRYSLGTLFLVFTIAALSITVVMMWREVGPLRAETEKMRNEAGYLTIEHPERIHAIMLDSDDPFVWKWKVHLPDGLAAQLGVEIGELPEQDAELPTAGPVGLPATQRAAGPYTAQVSVIRDLDNKWVARIQLGGVSMKRELTDAQLAMLRDAKGFATNGVHRETSMAQEGEPLVLLRRTYFSPADLNGSPDDSPVQGVLIWIQPFPKSR